MANEELVAQIAAMGGAGILLLLVVLAIVVAPVFLVMFSKRVHGGKKLFWIVMMGTFSWLAYPPYLAALRKAGKAPDEPGKAPDA